MHPYVTVHGNGDEGVALASELTFALCRRHQHLLDKSTQHVLARWLGLGLLLSLYAVRVTVQIQGFYVVSYGLAIYILNLFVAFLSPKIDPALPMSASDEFRPFIRCLSEFEFWYSITKAVCVALVLTFFSVFDIPVVWPVLLVYWVGLFVATMRTQILHMIKYKYVPFSFGKQSYGK